MRFLPGRIGTSRSWNVHMNVVHWMRIYATV